MNEGATNKSQSFLDFGNDDSLVLSRLDDDKTWDDVSDLVKEDNQNGSPRITLCGHLRGRTRRNNPLLVGDVQLEVMANTPEQREVWLNQIRARIAPWVLLQQGLEDVADDEPSPEVMELKKALRGLVTSRDCTEPPSILTGKNGASWLDFLGTLPKRWRNYPWRTS